MTTTTGGGTRPAADAIDRAAQATGIEDGWVVLNPDLPRGRVRVWLGDDLVRLARAADVGVVATDGTPEAWLADATRATAWRAIVTADGRTAWYATGALVAPDGPCTSEPRAPDPLAGVRSLTCWIDRARCLEAVAAAMRTAPDAFGPGTDVAATTTGTCPPGARCLLSGPNTPALVTAMNAGVPSPAGLRAFTAGWRRLPVLVRELEPDEIDARVLAAVARPSIALPVSTPDETAASFCPAAGIDGRLHGSPWDPRVAWVGPNTVRWPAGTMALFLPDLVLVAPAGQGYRPGDVLQVSGTAGATAVFVACRITGDASAPLRSVP